MTRSSFTVPVAIVYSGFKSVAFLVVCLVLVAGCGKKSEELETLMEQKVSGPEKSHSLLSHSLLNDPDEEEKDVERQEPGVEAGPVVGWSPAKNQPWTELVSASDTWDLCFLQGSRVGYTHTQIKLVRTKDRQEAVEIETTSNMKIYRFGQSTEVNLTIRSLESLRGELIAFTEEQRNRAGAKGNLSSQATQGRVDGDQLNMVIAGKRRSLAWSASNGGFLALEHSLLSAPMKPGERRRMRHLVPMFDTVATVELHARQIEPVKLLHGTYQLLRIDMETNLPGGGSMGGVLMKGAIWIDSRGQSLKTYIDLLDQETYRVTREEALAKYEPGKIDLGFDKLVKLDRPIDDPHTARLARYIVTLKDADPATVFTSGLSQSVEPIDAHTVRLVVQAIRPGDITADDSDPSDLPTREDLEPNGFIESNDPTIRAMAETVAKGTKLDWERAVAAERYVNQLLAKGDYSQVFSTAAETAKTRRGDCSEYSVLLAAIGRAMGIPSRVVIGLVYSKSLGAFGFHMWNEMYIDGVWIPMDATLGRGGIGVGHLKLGHTSLPAGLADPVFLAIPKTVGKLGVKVER